MVSRSALHLEVACGIAVLVACFVSLEAASVRSSGRDVLHEASEGGLPRARSLLDSSSCSTKSYPTDGSRLKPVTFPAPITDVRWAGKGAEFDQYAYALLEGEALLDAAYIGGRVFLSKSYGRAGTWVDITNRMDGAAGDDYGDYSGIVEIYFRDDQPETILFQGAGQSMWLTHDHGATFTKVDTPGGMLGVLVTIKPHPTQPEWLLATAPRTACWNFTEANTAEICASDLFVSKDFAKTWTNLTAASGGAVAAFKDFEWGPSLSRPGSGGDETAFQDETILASVYESLEHARSASHSTWDPNVHFVVSHDFFASAHTRLVPCGNRFQLMGHRVFLALPSTCPMNPDGSARTVPTDASANNVVLYTSADEAITWEQACLPVAIPDLAYNLVSTHDEGNAFLIVDHDEEDLVSALAPIGNVYAPSYNSSLFTLSLARNFRGGRQVDFARVEGMPGVFIANQLDLRALSRRHQPHSPADPQYDKYVASKITFNGGGRWQDLATPATYRHSACNRCGTLRDPSKCRLHLFGLSSWHAGPDGRPAFYSQESSPGIVMGVGNTGEFLDAAADALCTWLSRDGGLTWEDVAPSAGIYEYGDHGGLVVMSTHETEGPAEEISFSTDLGTCWHTVRLSEAIDVQNIRVEPRGASSVMVVHGEACYKTAAHPTCTWDANADPAPKGKAYILDFQRLLGSDWRACGKSDYEQWSPPSSDMCLLGRNITQERRQRGVTCFNGKEYLREDSQSTPCPCGTADVECEFGFEEVDGTCRALEGLDRSRCESVSSGRYVESASHLRLVAGNACEGVARVIPDTDGKGHAPGGPAAPAAQRRRRLATALIVFLVLAFAGAGFAVWWVFWAGPGAKDAVEEAFSPLMSAIVSAALWLRDAVLAAFDRITGRSRRQAMDAYFQPLAGGDEFGLDLDPRANSLSMPERGGTA